MNRFRCSVDFTSLRTRRNSVRAVLNEISGQYNADDAHTPLRAIMRVRSEVKSAVSAQSLVALIAFHTTYFYILRVQHEVVWLSGYRLGTSPVLAYSDVGERSCKSRKSMSSTLNQP